MFMPDDNMKTKTFGCKDFPVARKIIENSCCHLYPDFIEDGNHVPLTFRLLILLLPPSLFLPSSLSCACTRSLS